MYVNVKQRPKKNLTKVYYIYLSESHRVEGKVKNTQRYVGSISEERLAERDYSFLDESKLQMSEAELELIIKKLNGMAK